MPIGGGRCELKEVWPLLRAHLLPYWSLLFSSDPSLFLFYPQCPSSVGRLSTQLPLVQKEVPFSWVCWAEQEESSWRECSNILHMLAATHTGVCTWECKQA